MINVERSEIIQRFPYYLIFDYVNPVLKFNFLYRFIPCVEYSKELSGRGCEWDGTKYSETGSRRINKGNKIVTVHPINDIIKHCTAYAKQMENNELNILYINNVSNDILLEFDFKERYDNTFREGKLRLEQSELTESEAKEYYYEHVRHNEMLKNTMLLAESKKIGDIDKALKACYEFRQYNNINDVFTGQIFIDQTRNFRPWLPPVDTPELRYIRPNVIYPICNLKISDFYTIVPDNPSINDLVEAYEPHKEFLKNISQNFKSQEARYRLYNQYCREGIEFNHSTFPLNMFFLAVFTKQEFEELLMEMTKVNFYRSSFDDNYLRKICTYKSFRSSMCDFLKVNGDAYKKQSCYDYMHTITESSNYIILKLVPERNCSGGFSFYMKHVRA